MSAPETEVDGKGMFHRLIANASRTEQPIGFSFIKEYVPKRILEQKPPTSLGQRIVNREDRKPGLEYGLVTKLEVAEGEVVRDSVMGEVVTESVMGEVVRESVIGEVVRESVMGEVVRESVQARDRNSRQRGWEQ